MSITRLALAISAVTLAVGAGLAFASTSTNTPGSACVAVSGTLTPGSSGQVSATSSNGAVAVCPIDREIAPTASTNLSATVWVVGASTVQGVCCNVASYNEGGALIQGGQECTTSASSSVTSLSLPQLTDTKTFSHFFIQCTLPAPQSGQAPSQIVTYRSVQS